MPSITAYDRVNEPSALGIWLLPDVQFDRSAIPDHLAGHTRLLDELEQVGRWLTQATKTPHFPDQATAALVAMTIQDLKDRRAL